MKKFENNNQFIFPSMFLPSVVEHTAAGPASAGFLPSLFVLYPIVISFCISRADGDGKKMLILQKVEFFPGV